MSKKTDTLVPERTDPNSFWTGPLPVCKVVALMCLAFSAIAVICPMLDDEPIETPISEPIIEVQSFRWHTVVEDMSAHTYTAQMIWNLSSAEDYAPDRRFLIPLESTDLVRSVELKWAGECFVSETVPTHVARIVRNTANQVAVPSATVLKHDNLPPSAHQSSVFLDVSMPKNGTLIVTVTVDGRATLKDGWHSVPVSACSAATDAMAEHDNPDVTIVFTPPGGHKRRLRVLSNVGAHKSQTLPREWEAYNAEHVATASSHDPNNPNPLESTTGSRIWQVSEKDGTTVWRHTCKSQRRHSDTAPMPPHLLLEYAATQTGFQPPAALMDIQWDVEPSTGFFLHRFRVPKELLPVQKTVVIALDVSGAMTFGKVWRVAKFAVRRVLSQLQEGDRFTILPYTWRPGTSLFQTPVAVSEDSINAVEKMLRDIRPSSSADTDSAIQASLELLRATPDMKQPTIVVVTGNSDTPRHKTRDWTVQGVKCDLNVVKIWDAKMPGAYQNTWGLIRLARSSGGVCATLNATDLAARCPGPCDDANLATGVFGSDGILLLDAMLEHTRPALVAASLTYSFPTAHQTIMTTDRTFTRGPDEKAPRMSIRAQSEVLVLGRMLLPGEHAWWRSPPPPPGPRAWNKLTMQEQFYKLQDRYSSELGPMTLADFQLADPRDLERFLDKHVQLHMARKVRDLFAAQSGTFVETSPTSRCERVDCDSRGRELALPKNATHPPLRPELTIVGRTRDDSEYKRHHIISDSVEAATPAHFSGSWSSPRLIPVVLDHGVRTEVLSPPRSIGIYPKTGAELALAAQVVSGWSSMSVSAFSLKLDDNDKKQEEDTTTTMMAVDRGINDMAPKRMCSLGVLLATLTMIYIYIVTG